MTYLLLLPLVVYFAAVVRAELNQARWTDSDPQRLQTCRKSGDRQSALEHPNTVVVRPATRSLETDICMSRRTIMNKRWYLQREKRPVRDRSGVGDLGKALSRILRLNVFDETRSLSPSPWTQNHGGGAPISLVPFRISIGRKQSEPK